MRVLLPDRPRELQEPMLFMDPGHDAWVNGDEPVIAVGWGGAHFWGKRGD